MTGYSCAVMVETCYIIVSVIAQLFRQRIAGGGRLGRLKFRGRIRTDEGRHGHAVGDVAWDIGSWAMDSCLMR
jgi:hypothetical protein